jgi:hypothetical protein
VPDVQAVSHVALGISAIFTLVNIYIDITECPQLLQELALRKRMFAIAIQG